MLGPKSKTLDILTSPENHKDEENSFFGKSTFLNKNMCTELMGFPFFLVIVQNGPADPPAKLKTRFFSVRDPLA